jgi:ribosome-binding protein aMBF1 (putative translation factor)
MSSAYDKITLLDKWRLVQKLVSDPSLSRCAVACGFHLIDLYNTRLDRAWPSYDTLATLAGANRRTVITAVKRLLASDYFEVERGSGRRSNYYRPNFSLIKSVPQQSLDGDQNTTTSGAQTSPLQGVEVNASPPNTSYIPVAPSVGDTEVSPRFAGSSALVAPSPSRGAPPGFEEFWQAYPKKEGRKAALKAYAMALQQGKVTPSVLAVKAAQYAYAKGDQDPKWVKLPRTWLDEECWLEDPQPSGRKKPSETAKESRSGKSARTKTAASRAKPAPKSKPKTRRRKKRRVTRSVQPKNFGNAVPIYCDFLGITLNDLAAATGVNARVLKRACAGEARMPNSMKNKLQALLIEAVIGLKRDRPLRVEDLRVYYEEWIKDRPLTRYLWRRPEFYEKQRPT